MARRARRRDANLEVAEEVMRKRRAALSFRYADLDVHAIDVQLTETHGAARVAKTMWRARFSTASNGAPGQNAPGGACAARFRVATLR